MKMMTNPRIKDGEFRQLTQHQLYDLAAEFDRECEPLDVIQPTFEAWLAAKLYDLRESIGALSLS
jgi:hypothetical protein